MLLEVRSTIRTIPQPTLSMLIHSALRVKSGGNCVEDSEKRRDQKLRKRRAQAAAEAYQPRMSIAERAIVKSNIPNMCFASVYSLSAERGICSRAGH